jgi:hypothetical protein
MGGRALRYAGRKTASRRRGESLTVRAFLSKADRTARTGSGRAYLRKSLVSYLQRTNALCRAVTEAIEPGVERSSPLGVSALQHFEWDRDP